MAFVAPEGRGQEDPQRLRRSRGAGHPRGDPRRRPPRRPRLQRHPPDPLRGRRAAPRARLGGLHPRRDAGDVHRHARHQLRRAARRRADRGVQPEVHAALQLPQLQRGRSAADPRPRPARDRPRRTGRAQPHRGAARRRAVPLHRPHHQRHPGVQRLQLDGLELRRMPGADGRRRADHQARRRHLHRPGAGGRQAGAAHRHHRRGRPLRRHGLQGRAARATASPPSSSTSRPKASTHKIIRETLHRARRRG